MLTSRTNLRDGKGASDCIAFLLRFSNLLRGVLAYVAHGRSFSMGLIKEGADEHRKARK